MRADGASGSATGRPSSHHHKAPAKAQNASTSQSRRRARGESDGVDDMRYLWNRAGHGALGAGKSSRGMALLDGVKTRFNVGLSRVLTFCRAGPGPRLGIVRPTLRNRSAASSR
ncbi:hypothetical protein GCM10009429_02400 [Dyella marensis]